MVAPSAIDLGPEPAEYTTPTKADQAKVKAILKLRKFHSRTIERASAVTYRRRQLPASIKPVVEPAASVYCKDMGWLPPGLLAPTKTPKSAAVPMLSYYLPYYATSKIAWSLYYKHPVDDSLLWSTKARWDDEFPSGETGWDLLDPDAAFAKLRLQGPNPFLLARVDARPELGEDPTDVVFEADYAPIFNGVFVAVACRFRAHTSGAFTPSSITINGETYRPDDTRWESAKQVVNGLDARYAVFGSHLFYCHLIIGQAFALSAYELPTWHCLRPFLDFFTYGTLPVNDAAYKSLLTDQSYFVMANFVTRESAPALVNNLVESFDFRTAIAPADIAHRGLAAVPDHPYVHDATMAWDAIHAAVTTFVDSVYPDDASVTADRDLGHWHSALHRALLDDPAVPSLDGVDSVITLLSALLFNNVVHEVCGNLAPLLGNADEPSEQAVVNIDHLADVAAGRTAPAPRAGEVFLLNQAVFVSRFNVGGNNLLELNGDRLIDDPRVQAFLRELQPRLRTVGAELRSLDRQVRFNAMFPRRWEASISF